MQLQGHKTRSPNCILVKELRMQSGQNDWEHDRPNGIYLAEKKVPQ